MKKLIAILLVLLGVAALLSQAQHNDPVVTLTGWDQGTGRLSGTMGGQPFTAIVLSSSSTGISQEPFFPSTNVKRALAEQWNSLVRNSATKEFGLVTTGNFSSLLASMTAYNCNVQLTLNKDGIVKSIRPVP
jgi:hypothetical protein